MKKLILIQFLFFLMMMGSLWSQDFSIPAPKLVFEDGQLLIYYDLISDNSSDKFHVWVELEKKSGEHIEIKALTGDVGDVKPGTNKMITWNPVKDAVYID